MGGLALRRYARKSQAIGSSREIRFLPNPFSQTVGNLAERESLAAPMMRQDMYVYSPRSESLKLASRTSRCRANRGCPS